MPKFLTAFLVCATIFSIQANAQTDTSYLDLGRVRLNKQFTQTVTIKGEDLERYPFTNLADAINVWLYGTNTAPATLTYVIDGFQVNDVNTYHIHDIEEVTLVQNALAATNGGLTTRQMVVIKLRKNLDKPSGFTALGQTSFINLHNSPTGATENGKLYNNYYISGFKNTGQVHYGVSVNFLGDAPVTPNRVAFTVNKPLQLNRFRTNAYFNTSELKPTYLDFTIGYTPQTATRVMGQNPYNDPVSNYDLTQYVFNTALKVTSKIVNGLSNEFKAGYNHYNYDYNIASHSNNDYNLMSGSIDKAGNIFFSDDIRYHKTWGNWAIEPKAGISYQKETFSQDSSDRSRYAGQPTPPISTYHYDQSIKWWTITPDVSLTYKTDLNITGGVQYYTTFSGHNPLKLYPFVSASANILHLLNEQSHINLTLFGSYSRSIKLYNEVYELADYNHINYSGVYFNDPVSLGVSGAYVYNGTINTRSDNNNYNAGLKFTTNNGRLTANYVFESRSFLTEFPFTIYNGGFLNYYYVPFNSHYQSNYLSVTYKLFNAPKLGWLTGINSSTIHIKYNRINNASDAFSSAQTGENIKTGGWVNRINAGRVIAGLDVLYQFGGHLYNSTDKINSFSLQNVYLGAKFKSGGGKSFELYASGRNVLQNNQSIITDGRRFFGLGFKLEL